MLLDAEKYGNDQDGADAMAVDLHEYVCRTVRDLAPQVGLHSYMVVIINNEANTVLGRFTAASADGRKARESMANANNPAGGTDQNGVTAMLNSLVKLRTDIHAGAVQNMTFSPELFNDNRPVLRALLQTYFDNGGPQCMINVLHRGDLEDAMAHPERHQSLLVRVGGFSARFVTLSPDVQREIASRTLY
ncbi:MAG: pyruvate formate-lyase, partial [Clostridia bacterium]|nr:pyruvate formate-lyase [Clostridia bacterium]